MICKSSNFVLADCSIEALNKNNLHSFATLCISNDPLMKEGQQKRISFLNRKMTQNLWGFIAFDSGGNIAGFVDALPIEHAPQGIQGEDIYVIQCINVRDDMQGKGLGKELIKRAVERSRDRAGLAVIAYDDPEIKPAGFFAHIGFEELQQNGPVKLLWMPNKPMSEPKLSWRRNKDKNDDKTETAQRNIRIELVTNDLCPYSFRMGKIITRIFGSSSRMVQIMLRRPEEKPLWRRLDIFPNLYVNDQLKSIWALNEEELRALLDGVIPQPTMSVDGKNNKHTKGGNSHHNGEKAKK
jgi:N-acetylglutamate synthase-like GNAT family acetyltransferase